MESATKNHQPIETLQAMVARGFSCPLLGWDYDVVRSVVVENAGSLDEAVDRVRRVGPMDSNVMVRDGTIVSIIDHERAFFGRPPYRSRLRPHPVVRLR